MATSDFFREPLPVRPVAWQYRPRRMAGGRAAPSGRRRVVDAVPALRADVRPALKQERPEVRDAHPCCGQGRRSAACGIPRLGRRPVGCRTG